MSLNFGIRQTGQRPRAGMGRGAGRGRGRMGGGFAAGPGGQCVCTSCGHTIQHQAGVPCYQIKCPKCGAQMTRGK